MAQLSSCLRRPAPPRCWGTTLLDLAPPARHADRTEQGGAVLTVEPGWMACVEFEPVSGAFAGYTPPPDGTACKLELPDGITIEPNGKVGMVRVTTWPKESRLAIEHAVRWGETESASAPQIQVRGMHSPAVWVHGESARLDAYGSIALPHSF